MDFLTCLTIVMTNKTMAKGVNEKEVVAQQSPFVRTAFDDRSPWQTEDFWTRKPTQRNMNRMVGSTSSTVCMLGTLMPEIPTGSAALWRNSSIFNPFFVAAIMWSVQPLAGFMLNSPVPPTATCQMVPKRAVKLGQANA